MAALSISRAWEEGIRFAGREFWLLYPVALLLMEMPALALMLVTPAPAEFMTVSPVTVSIFGTFLEQFGGLSSFLLFVGLSFAVLVVQTFGGLAITWLALRPGARIADSLGIAGRALPAMIGLLLLVSLGTVILMMPTLLMVFSSPSQMGVGAALGSLLSTLVLTVLLIAVVPRLSLVTPVAAAERKGTFALLARSWNLTRGHYWTLFGTFLLIALVAGIALMAVALVLGALTALLVGPPTTSFTASFVLELLNSLFVAAYSVFLLCFIARIYAQLAEPETQPA